MHSSSTMAALIERYTTAKRASNANWAACNALADSLPKLECRVMVDLPTDGEPQYAHSVPDIKAAYRLFLAIPDFEEQARKRMRKQIKDLERQFAARARQQDAVGLTALDKEGERLIEELSEATDALIAAKPVTLGEARAKMAALADYIVERLSNSIGPDDPGLVAGLV
jgi:hypothetical protein